MARLILILIVFTSRTVAIAGGQEGDAFWQARPTLTANIDLGSRARLQVFGKFEGGLNYSYSRARTGVTFSYRMKRILKPHPPVFDDEDEHNLVVGGGYEFLERSENNELTREHRIGIDVTPRYLFGGGFFATDRNRIEFRWIDRAYNARYRNRLAIHRQLEMSNFRFTPYAAGELFYDRNRHAWNRTNYGFGSQFPAKGRFMVDTFYLRENCSGCSRSPTNIWGVTLNLYFNHNKL